MRDEDKTKEQLIDELRRLRLPAPPDGARLVGAWSWDVRSDAVLWSSEQWRHFGLPEHQTRLTLQQALERIHPEDRPQIRRALAQAQSDHRPFEFVFRIPAGDGKNHLLNCRGQVTVGRDGRPQSLSGVLQDASGQRRADEALTLSQRRLQ